MQCGYMDTRPVYKLQSSISEFYWMKNNSENNTVETLQYTLYY